MKVAKLAWSWFVCSIDYTFLFSMPVFIFFVFPLSTQRPPANPVLEDGDDDAALERAMEDLFAQLEMDLESSVADSGDDEEFTEEELALMAKELQDAFDEAGLEFEGLDDEESGPKTVDMFMKDGMYSDDSVVHNRGEQEEEDEDEEGVEDEDEEDEERMVPLEKWQLRKLAAAAEKGRRNVNVIISHCSNLSMYVSKFFILSFCMHFGMQYHYSLDK